MKIGIAIVHFGDFSHLEKCLTSLKVIPTDIESIKQWSEIKTDDVISNLYLHELDDVFEIRIFNCNNNNVGFSIANNYLIKLFLIDPQISWVWLLNNDTEVPTETVTEIARKLDGYDEYDEGVGVIGFQIRSMADPDLIHHAGTYDCYPAGIHKSGSVKLGQHTHKTYEKWVTFASVLISTKTFITGGLLDPNMFNYFSDSDFCFRARMFGYKVVYEPTFIVYHRIGSSANPNPEQMQMLQSDSMIFENKWMNGKTFFDLDKEVF